MCVCVCAGVYEFVEHQCLKRHLLSHLLFSYQRSLRYVFAVNGFGKCRFYLCKTFISCQPLKFYIFGYAYFFLFHLTENRTSNWCVKCQKDLTRIVCKRPHVANTIVFRLLK